MTAIPGPTFTIADVGTEVTRPVMVPLECTGAGLTVEVSVLDDLGEPVAFSAELEKSSVVRAHVTFRPDRPGSYHLTARFQPNLGIGQADVLVVPRVQEDAGVPLLADFAGCEYVDRTPGGLWVCLDGANSFVATDTVRVQELPVSLAVMSGGVVWTASGERWVEGVQVDGGRGFSRSPAGQPGPGGTDVSMAGPTPDDVVFAQVSGPLRRLRHADGGFSVDDLGQRLPSSTLPTLWRGGDTIVQTAPTRSGCQPLDAGMRLCSGPLRAQWFDPDGMWSALGGVGSSSLSVYRSDQPIEQRMPDQLEFAIVGSTWGACPLFWFEPASANPAVYTASYRGRVIVTKVAEHLSDVRACSGDWVILANPLRAVPRQ